jgi:hypothetical protein
MLYIVEPKLYRSVCKLHQLKSGGESSVPTHADACSVPNRAEWLDGRMAGLGWAGFAGSAAVIAQLSDVFAVFFKALLPSASFFFWLNIVVSNGRAGFLGGTPRRASGFFRQYGVVKLPFGI